MRNRLSILLLLLFSVPALSQSDVTVKRHEFKQGREGFSEAWKHIETGDRNYFLAGVWYADAYTEYLKASSYNNSNPELLYKLGVSALFSGKKGKAADYFLPALEAKPDVAPDILVLSGNALRYRGEFRKAAEMLEKYLDSPGKKKESDLVLATKYLEECKSAIEVTSDTLDIEIVNAGQGINSPADDYSEFVAGDDNYMIFASRRPTDKSSRYYADGKYDENIYVSAVEDASWGSPVQAGAGLSTSSCETPLWLAPGGDTVFIYAGYVNGGDILFSEKRKGKWKTPEDFRAGINSKYRETSFTFSPSRQELWFVSDRKGDSRGGTDIYLVSKKDPKHWSEPQNAGLVNSSGNEESVRFSAAGDTLWFSSTGHNSIGGFDIFYSVRNGSGEWSAPVNAGYPLNTQWDELFYLPSYTDPGLFYFVSNREGGFGGLDIYTGRYRPQTLAGSASDSLSVR